MKWCGLSTVSSKLSQLVVANTAGRYRYRHRHARALLHDQVSEDIDELSFNTAISALMVLTNHLMTFDKPPREALEVKAGAGAGE